MTPSAYPPITGLSFRLVARAAFTSGIIGVLAFGALIMALTTRSSTALTNPWFKVHDVGVIFQFGFLIPLVYVLDKLAQLPIPTRSSLRLIVGIGALSLVILFLLFSLINFVADTMYMVPQGIFGLWLLLLCWHGTGFLTKGLRWAGMVVGFGLLLTGSFPLGYGLLVDPILFAVPAVPLGDGPAVTTLSNTLIHLTLAIGTFIGVLPLPIWTMLIGDRLLQRKIS
ncbi:hypothetical protein [Spirosoma litoris]